MPDIDELLSVWEEKRERGQAASPEEICRDCPELLEELRWNIRALQAVDSHFRPTNDQYSTPNAQRSRGHQVGVNEELEIASHFRIERHHASGGLGEVFVAIEPTLNRRVAIKFPRIDRTNALQLARFEREARITSRLDHPGIVAVHAQQDGDSGRPCYVMRFVDGPTLQARVQQFHEPAAIVGAARFQSAEFRQLLQHFVSLCGTVAYAHSQGVIHRDIKPGNVILGPYGETLLMDWGLARSNEEVSEPETEQRPEPAASPTGPHAGDLTQSGQILGTPAFASPEQLLGKPDLVSERSDIYSLGASLYYLISGQLPMHGKSITDHLQWLAGITSSPLEFGDLFPPVLKAICQRATAVDSQQRYASAMALSEDLQRYLAFEPVSVFRDSWGVRAGRWLRKHPTVAVSSAVSLALLLASLAAGLVLVGNYNRRLEQARENESLARSEAEANFQSALEAVNQFLVQVTDNRQLKEADFSDLRGELLKTAVPFFEALRDRKPGDAEVEFDRADAWFKLALIQKITGDPGTSIRSVRESIAINSQLVAKEPTSSIFRLALARCQDELGVLQRLAGQLDEAIESHHKALKIAQPLLEPGVVNQDILTSIAGTRNNLALALKQMGQFAEARDQLATAIGTWQELLKKDPLLSDAGEFLVHGHTNLGMLHEETGEYEQASKEYQAARKQVELLLASEPDNPGGLELRAALENNSGLLRWKQGKLPEAARELELAATLRSELAARYPSSLEARVREASSLMNLAVLRTEAGQNQQARANYEAALRLWQQLLERDPGNPEYLNGAAMTGGNLALLLDNLGARKEARSRHSEAMVQREKLATANPDQPGQQVSFAGACCNYGSFLEPENPEEALRWYDRAEGLLKEVLRKHPALTTAREFLCNTHQQRAVTFEKLARYSEASEQWEAASKLATPDFVSPLQQRVNSSRRKAELAIGLDELIDRKRPPADVEEHQNLAAHCYNRQLFLRSAEEYRQLLEQDDPAPGVRVGAARSVGRLLAGYATDAPKPDEAEKLRWRKLALGWLRAELNEAQTEPSAHEAFFGLLTEFDLEVLREPESLQLLPERERKGWESFWMQLRKLDQTNRSIGFSP